MLTPGQVVIGELRPPAGRTVVYDGDGYLRGGRRGRAARAGRPRGRGSSRATTRSPFCRRDSSRTCSSRAWLHECGVTMPGTGTVLRASPLGASCSDANGSRSSSQPAAPCWSPSASPSDALYHETDGVRQRASSDRLRRAAAARRGRVRRPPPGARSTATPRSRCPTCASAGDSAVLVGRRRSGDRLQSLLPRLDPERRTCAFEDDVAAMSPGEPTRSCARPGLTPLWAALARARARSPRPLASAERYGA